MKTSLRLLAVTMLSVGVSVSGCGGDDTTDTGTDGSAGTTAEGGAGAGGSAGTSGGGGSAGSLLDGAADSSTVDAGLDAPAEALTLLDTGLDTGVDAGNPPPALGAQIDRMGRPAVNTALTDPFDIVTALTPEQVKDAYNAAADPTTWSTNFKGYIAQNLAILDALDSRPAVIGPPAAVAFEGCGNQFAIGAPGDGGATTAYSGLAGVLVDDRLYVNTTVNDAGTITCTTYLGVEANATGIIPNADCGGRKPEYDVIDESYSVLAAGTLSGVTDGVSFDNKTTAAFPFLAAPQ